MSKRDSVSSKKAALLGAVRRGDIARVRMLIRSVQEPRVLVNASAERGMTAIHLAAARLNAPMVRLLIKHGAALLAADDSYGRRPIHCALLWSKDEDASYAVVRDLIEAGEDVNGVSLESETPLAIACQKGFLRVVRLLLRNGAILVTGSSKYHTPASLAAAYGHADVLEYLLRRGEKPDSVAQGKPLMYWAKRSEDLDTIGVTATALARTR